VTARGPAAAGPDRAGQQVRAGAVLAWAALVAAVVAPVVTALLLGAAALEDGDAPVVLLGLPALCCAAGVLGARWPSRWALPLMAAAAVVCLAWALVTALGVGFLPLVPAVLLVAATVLSGSGRLERRLDEGPRTAGR